MAARTKASETDGPATFPAVRAVRVKMPAPMTTATPKTVRSQAVRSLRSLVSGFVGVRYRLFDGLGAPNADSGHGGLLG